MYISDCYFKLHCTVQTKTRLFACSLFEYPGCCIFKAKQPRGSQLAIGVKLDDNTISHFGRVCVDVCTCVHVLSDYHECLVPLTASVYLHHI